MVGTRSMDNWDTTVKSRPRIFQTEGGARMTSPEAIGSVLQANRVKQGLSIQEVAERLGTPRATVWRWETGKRKPSYEFVVKLRGMGLLP